MSENNLTGAAARALVERMGEAAANWLASLAADQRAQAVFPFADENERTTWHYTPVKRSGLPLVEMDPRQRRLAQQLVTVGLSRAGYVTAATIMGLERTLDAIEGFRRPDAGRDTLCYYVSLFGEPHEGGGGAGALRGTISRSTIP